MSDTVETWKKRVASWRASGETAEQFSEGRPWSPKTLRWYSSRFGRPAVPVVRVAQLVRSSTPVDRERERGGSIVIEALDARLRITIEAGAERDTVAMVLGTLVPEAR
ncbi:MAG: hypothetical protein H0U66_09630 [Gemmatimonadaceae bacterium]|nr:hypothetical protein [Gemmatimonadaceae bacterium]